jgi:nucleotide-binding universal stress UspA family protein
MTIVVASDLTFRSDRAIARGDMVARERGEPLHIVHVVDEKQRSALVDHAVSWSRETLAHECAIHAPNAMTHVIVGDPKHRILREVEALGGTLLVLGMHDEKKDGAFTFGQTTAGRMVLQARCPVLLAVNEPAGPYTRAVVGIDFSVHSRIAVEETNRLFPRTPMTLAHAYVVPFRDRLAGEEYLADVAAEERRQFDAFLADEMGWVLERAKRAGAPAGHVETLMQEGRANDVMRDIVKKRNADLVVIGTHGGNMIERLLWGSVANALLTEPPCDVLVVDAKRRTR